MQKKAWILTTLMAATFATAMLLPARSGNSSPDPEKKNTACCHVIMQECPEKQKTNAPGEMIIESLSRQFLFVSPF